jgi:membrane fusion protein (multidrug efflux system)
MADRSRKKLLYTILSVFATLGMSVLIYYKMHYTWTNDALIDGYAVDSSANVTEKVMDLFVEEGDEVKKGQLLANLRTNIPLAQKEEALAKIDAARQDVFLKESNYLKIRNDYERALKGIQDRIITAQEFDHKEKDFFIAEAALELSKANLEVAQKELKTIDARLLHYQVIADQDGIIAKRWVWPGDVVLQGQSLFTIYDLKNIWILANLQERSLRKVRLGSKVKIHIDAYPWQLFDGTVFSINGASAAKFTLVPQNNATGNYTKVEQRVPIKISIDIPQNYPKDKPLYLFPGMSAEVFIEIGS